MTKSDVNEKGYLWYRTCLFLVATAFLMRLEIYRVTFEKMIFVSFYCK